MNAVLGLAPALERRLEEQWQTKAKGSISRLKRAEVVGWPQDLRHWVTPSTLLVWIEEELNNVDWQNPSVLDHLRGYPEYRPRPMLRLLSFAYAAGVLYSDAVSQACESDPLLHLLCDGPVPFAEELISFRRKNGSVLECILQKLLLRALREKMDLRACEISASLLGTARDWAQARVRLARQLDGEEPER